jgi:hypothetical protein
MATILTVEFEGPGWQRGQNVNTFPVDEHFISTLNLEWAIPPQNTEAFSAKDQIVINETAAAQLGNTCGELSAKA